MQTIFFDSSTSSARSYDGIRNRDLGRVEFAELSRRAWLANWCLVVNGRVVFRPRLKKSACSVIRAARSEG